MIKLYIIYCYVVLTGDDEKTYRRVLDTWENQDFQYILYRPFMLTHNIIDFVVK